MMSEFLFKRYEFTVLGMKAQGVLGYLYARKVLDVTHG
jgi:hypothetical protein